MFPRGQTIHGHRIPQRIVAVGGQRQSLPLHVLLLGILFGV